MIKFKTKYDSNIVRRACIYAIEQIIIPLVVLTLIFFTLGILNFVFKQNVVAGILWIVFSLIYIPIVYFVIYLTQTNKYKAQYLKQIDQDLNLVDCCEFDNNSVVLITLAEKEGYEKELDKEVLAYSDFLSVKEKQNEYIFSKQHSVIVIVPKSSLIDGTIEEFNALLTQKYGDLFKKYVKKEEKQENTENLTTTETTPEQTQESETYSELKAEVVEVQDKVEPENAEANDDQEFVEIQEEITPEISEEATEEKTEKTNENASETKDEKTEE